MPYLPLGAFLMMYHVTTGILLVVIFFPTILFADDTLQYRVRFQGSISPEIKKSLTAASDTITFQKRTPFSLNILQRRVERDIPRFVKLLKSNGFYGALVTAEIKEKETPFLVIFHFVSGPQYVFKSVNTHLLEANRGLHSKIPKSKEIGLVLGAPVSNIAILQAEKYLVLWFKKNGHPFPQMKNREVVVDHKTHTVSVLFSFDSGPWAAFGPTKITGLQTVNEVFLRRKIPWKEGQTFNVGLFTDAQKRFIAMNLFALVEIKAEKSLNEEGRVPVIISFRERKHRTLKTGIGYQTDEGLGGSFSWEHRNVSGDGERMRFSGKLSELTRSAEAEFRKPEFMGEDQSLLFSIRTAEDHPDAYTSRYFTTSLHLEWLLTRTLILNEGVSYKVSDVEQFEKTDTFTLLSFPLQLRWDTSNNLLDATEGGLLAFHFAPFYDTSFNEMAFVKSRAIFNRFVKLPGTSSMILASKTTVGSISGNTLETVPADERFYAGGGGSIRGYAFQSVGPLFQNKPTGGRSLLEIAIELRTKVTDTLGFVTFLDGGTAFSDIYPDLGKVLLWGSGMGIRYFTPFGPVRLDIAVPLNRREAIDSRFQIYVSIGQAF